MEFLLGVFFEESLGRWVRNDSHTVSHVTIVDDTVDGRNPKQPPGMVLKPMQIMG